MSDELASLIPDVTCLMDRYGSSACVDRAFRERKEIQRLTNKLMESESAREAERHRLH